MRREYNREKIKLEYQGKTLQRDLKKKIEKKEPVVIFTSCSKLKKLQLNKFLKIIKWLPSMTSSTDNFKM